jgi:hypothetical protein
MNPRHFLVIAESLIREVENAPDLIHDGAKCRTTYNRAYYAAFLVACELFGTLGIKVPIGSKCHSAVKDGLNNSGALPLVKVGENLGTLYTGRADADYEMHNPRTESIKQARMNLDLARTLIGMIDAIRNQKLSPKSDLNVVATTILDWARKAGQPLYKK